MTDFSALLTAQERVSLKLRARFLAYGFLPYRMSKFEEYDLYAKNKDFLIDSQVITFTDTDGKLLALKPDVTLSIAKNFDSATPLQKLYYAENVYRPTTAGGFREILQSGVECMGQITGREVEEVLALSCECLSDISENFVLSVSDLGVLDALLGALGVSAECEDALCTCIAGKNAVEARRICAENGVEPSLIQVLVGLITTGVNLSDLAPLVALAKDCPTAKEAFSLLCELSQSACLAPFSQKIRFDFSVLPNRRFYNGVVFSGYVAGASRAVLSGGRYDKLMRRLNKNAQAIGFAVYLDRLPALERGM